MENQDAKKTYYLFMLVKKIDETFLLEIIFMTKSLNWINLHIVYNENEEF